VVVLSENEARRLNCSYIGTEHILLGLIHEGKGLAVKILESLGISLETLRTQIEETISQGPTTPAGHIPFTRGTRKVLELSLRESLLLGHIHIGTEHILLGLIAHKKDAAAQVLVKLGADLPQVRQRVIKLLPDYAKQRREDEAQRRKFSKTAKRIFISYRRQDTSHLAGRLSDWLADRFGHSRVFMDVDSLEPGIEFREAINEAVGSSEVLLALIGTGWLTATNEDGHRRLDDPDDIVRLEIEAALERGIRVIPVLAEGMTMPQRQDLPNSLARLVSRNAMRLSHESFRSDVARLIESLAEFLAKTHQPN
jgi:hypothetical protein